MKITVFANQPRFTMRGGFGASWHVIEQGPRHGAGSAWGCNPPADDIAGWKQLYRHADYLGLSFLRVELDQSMYHPERDRLDFEWAPMQPLYRILDWCQRRDAGVFVLAYTEEAARLTIRLEGCKHRLFHKYQVTAESCKRPPAEAINELACRESLSISSIDEIEDTIPGFSLTVYSSRRVEDLQSLYE